MAARKRPVAYREGGGPSFLTSAGRGMSTYLLRQRLIDIARKEVGTVEVPPNSNKGPRVQQYQAATSLAKEVKTGWPYCAAFVCWSINEWLKDAEVRAAFGFKTTAEVEAWRPKTAAAYGFHEWAANHKLLIMDDSPSNVLHTGDLVTFDFSHIGIVAADEGSKIYTIEGNTDSGGSRDGGGVFAKVRERSLARKFIRLLP